MEITINVDKMMCMHCKANVEKACMGVKNVVSAQASLENKNVVVKCNGGVAEDDIKKAIIDAGYTC